MAIRKRKSRHAGQTTLRHVWLAGLGAASFVRRDTIEMGGRMLTRAARLQQRARGVAERAKSGLVAVTRGALGAVIATFEDGIGTRLAPAMRKLALRPQANPGTVRRPPAKNTALGSAALQSRRGARKT